LESGKRNYFSHQNLSLKSYVKSSNTILSINQGSRGDILEREKRIKIFHTELPSSSLYYYNGIEQEVKLIERFKPASLLVVGQTNIPLIFKPNDTLKVDYLFEFLDQDEEVIPLENETRVNLVYFNKQTPQEKQRTSFMTKGTFRLPDNLILNFPNNTEVTFIIEFPEFPTLSFNFNVKILRPECFAPAGYWCTEDQIIQCYVSKYCNGGSQSKQCLDFHTGYLCESCINENYFKDILGICSPCNGSYEVVHTGLAFLILNLPWILLVRQLIKEEALKIINGEYSDQNSIYSWKLILLFIQTLLAISSLGTGDSLWANYIGFISQALGAPLKILVDRSTCIFDLLLPDDVVVLITSLSVVKMGLTVALVWIYCKFKKVPFRMSQVLYLLILNQLIEYIWLTIGIFRDNSINAFQDRTLLFVIIAIALGVIVGPMFILHGLINPDNVVEQKFGAIFQEYNRKKYSKIDLIELCKIIIILVISYKDNNSQLSKKQYEVNINRKIMNFNSSS